MAACAWQGGGGTGSARRGTRSTALSDKLHHQTRHDMAHRTEMGPRAHRSGMWPGWVLRGSGQLRPPLRFHTHALLPRRTHENRQQHVQRTE